MRRSPRALLRSMTSGEPALAQKIAGFHTVMEELITAALRGESVEDGRSPTAAEHKLAFVLQQVWFASLIGWSAGLHDQSGIVEQTRDAARLLLSNQAALCI